MAAALEEQAGLQRAMQAQLRRLAPGGDWGAESEWGPQSGGGGGASGGGGAGSPGGRAAGALSVSEGGAADAGDAGGAGLGRGGRLDNDAAPGAGGDLSRVDRLLRLFGGDDEPAGASSSPGGAGRAGARSGGQAAHPGSSASSVAVDGRRASTSRQASPSDAAAGSVDALLAWASSLPDDKSP